MNGQNRLRLGWGVSALLGLGLLFADAMPASADPPSHAKAWGYHRKHSDGHRHSRSCGHYNRYSYSRYDLDRDGIRNRRDRDIDGDRVPNRYDRHDYRYDGYSSSGHSTRWPRSMDHDGDGVRNKYDRHDHNPRRR